MQITMIHSLLELYKTKNISKASEKLYMTQQGLSRQIKALEKELGVILFVRKKDGVAPTEICHQLLPAFTSMYESYMKIIKVIDHEQHQKLCIGFAYGISHGLNNDFLVAYQKSFPNILLEIHEWSSQICQEKLLNEELDLAVLIEPFDQSNLNCQLLGQDNMYAAMHITHPFANTLEPLPFQCLADEQVITGPSDNALRRFFDYCCQLTKIHPQILMSSSYNIDFVNSMTCNTGISPLTSAMAFRITNPQVHIRKLLLPIPGNLYLCTSEHGERRTVEKQFTAFSIEYFCQNPPPSYIPKEHMPEFSE